MTAQEQLEKIAPPNQTDLSPLVIPYFPYHLQKKQLYHKAVINNFFVLSSSTDHCAQQQLLQQQLAPPYAGDGAECRGASRGTSAAEPRLLPQSHHSSFTAVQYCRGGSCYRRNSKRTKISASSSRYFLPSGAQTSSGLSKASPMKHAGSTQAEFWGGFFIGSHAAAGGKSG